MTVGFRLLGDIEAWAGGQPVKIGHAQLQSTLAVLLVEANRTVSVDQIVDRVWGERRLPRDPRGAVQRNVHFIRTALASARSRSPSTGGRSRQRLHH